MRRSTWIIDLVAAVSVLVLLLLWQLGAMVLDAQVILPTPGSTAVSFWSIIQSKPFSVNIWATVNRALRSFIIIVSSGMVFGILAGYSPILHALLKPVLVVFKATPVMSVILLAFIWFSSGAVPLFSAFLMGFPVMFIQVERGVGQISPRLTEMVKMYGFTRKMRFFHLVVPSLLPSIITGAKSSLSMVWKVVIAAEVLTVPRYGVGSRMQLSQVNLETSSVLAWTLIAVLLTAIGDLMFELILKFPSWCIARTHKRLFKRDEGENL
jgi:NitT/TauT family transport system permease protein